jgi:hypothetical protein
VYLPPYRIYASSHWRDDGPIVALSNACWSAFRADGLPRPYEIEPAVPQVDALNWQWSFEDAGTIVPFGITYQTIDRHAPREQPAN